MKAPPPESHSPVISIVGLAVNALVSIWAYRNGHPLVFGLLMFCGGGFLLAALLAQRHYERLRKIPTIKPTRSPSR
jgi:uncharacterized membrane protein YgdD (TMEM256/DUF423 family)